MKRGRRRIGHAVTFRRGGQIVLAVGIMMTSLAAGAAIVIVEFGGGYISDGITGPSSAISALNAKYPGWTDKTIAGSFEARLVFDTAGPNNSSPAEFLMQYRAYNGQTVTFSQDFNVRGISASWGGASFVAGALGSAGTNPFGFEGDSSLGIEIWNEPAFQGPEFPIGLDWTHRPNLVAYLFTGDLGATYWIQVEPDYFRTSAVPLPAACWLLLSGLGGLGLLGRRCNTA